jgi:hypothetical protein
MQFRTIAVSLFAALATAAANCSVTNFAVSAAPERAIEHLWCYGAKRSMPRAQRLNK